MGPPPPGLHLAWASQSADLSRTGLLLTGVDPLGIPSGLSSLTRLQPRGIPDSPLRLLCGVPPLGPCSCCDLCLLHGWAQLTCSGSLVNTGELNCSVNKQKVPNRLPDISEMGLPNSLSKQITQNYRRERTPPVSFCAPVPKTALISLLPNSLASSVPGLALSLSFFVFGQP